MISLVVFLICYTGFISFPKYKTAISLIGSAILILSGEIHPETAFREVHWNIMGLFFGTLILAELFMYSRVPAVLAEWLVDQSKTVRGALLSIFILSSVISIFVENVAVVLLIAPVALSLCEKLQISPVRPLILLAMFSNMQGSATLIGDPPSMILAAFMKLSFMDFFVYQGKPGLFFIVQVGFVFALGLAFWLFRKYSQPSEIVFVEKVLSWIPSLLLTIFVLTLVFGSHFDPDSHWLAGSAAMGLAFVGLIWHHFGPRWQPTKVIITSLDWKTTFFLMALFILVGSLRLAGWMNALSEWITAHIPADLLTMFIFIILISIVISAFVDNVPFLMALIPVIQNVSEATGFSLPLLAFGLLIGACLGGNITPIGASANIVAVSFLEKNGHSISFPAYVKVGLLFTIFAVIPSAIFLWGVWS